MFKYGKEELLESIIGKDYSFPVSSNKSHMMNKKLDYKVIMLLTLLSNKQTEEDAYEGSIELWRYIYRNKLTNYQELIEEISGSKLNTTFKTINKIIKEKDSVIKLRKTECGDIIYDIVYSTNHREFVIIDTNIMLELIRNFDSSAIKIYVLFCYMCVQKEKQMTQEWILKQIGLSVNNNNEQKITNITNALAKCGLINKRTITSESKRRITYYKVNSVQEWLDFNGNTEVTSVM